MPRDPKHIEHIFVVMMENRSFDHLLGYLDLAPHNRTDIIGIKDAQIRGYGNLQQRDEICATAAHPSGHWIQIRSMSANLLLNRCNGNQVTR